MKSVPVTRPYAESERRALAVGSWFTKRRQAKYWLFMKRLEG
jgi:hypothetical protein